MLYKRGQPKKAIEWTQFLATAIHSYREDHRYLDNISDDSGEMDGLMTQQQIGLEALSAPYRDPGLHIDAANATLSPPQSEKRILNAYFGRITGHRYERIVVDVTSPDAHTMGARMVKTVMPELAPDSPTLAPQLGHGRIQNEYAGLGILNRHHSPESLRYFPLPHA